MAETSLEVAKLHLLESGQQVDYQKIPVEELAKAQPASFDVVACLEMLEHVPDPVSVIKSCSELVKPSGWVFFSTLNRNLKSYFLSIIMAEYVLEMLPKGTHSCGRFIKPIELVKAAKSFGLTPYKMTGIHYNPLLQTFKLGRNTDVNYIIAFQKKA